MTTPIGTGATIADRLPPDQLAKLSALGKDLAKAEQRAATKSALWGVGPIFAMLGGQVLGAGIQYGAGKLFGEESVNKGIGIAGAVAATAGVVTMGAVLLGQVRMGMPARTGVALLAGTGLGMVSGMGVGKNAAQGQD